MEKLLPSIESPADLKGLSLAQLEQLAAEMREALCNLLSSRSAHFASNLGVVELCLALHTTFDFRRDRLIWDTGHQIYPHKLITGRYHEFGSIRTKGGLMGYPNPAESQYDLFMTGHAGASLSTALGLKSGDDLIPDQSDRRSVAVIGDGAFPSGIVSEAMNNAGGLRKQLLVVLNDNQMSICPRVGGLGEYLDRLRVNSFYTGLKSEVLRILGKVPLIGDPVERWLAHFKEAVKAGLHGGMLFEQLGFRYLGPIDGHNIAQLSKYLNLVKDAPGPVLLHVVTQKGHGFQPAAADPVYFHTPAPFKRDDEGAVLAFQKASSRAYTDVASETVYRLMAANERVTVMTAAMCQGTKLETVRTAFPQRFFDTGICESHTVAFAAGQAKAGLRPIVDIYSTFLQRSFDQIFQEVALQNLPVTFLLDRAGLVGADGPTHHGIFDLGYLRLFPNMVVAAPADEWDLSAMIEFALGHDSPVAIRYPKCNAEKLAGERAAIALGRAEVLQWGDDGMILAIGALVPAAVAAAAQLRAEGLDVGVVNARFVKPLDVDVVRQVLEASPFVVTVEEAALAGGFGSAVCEAASDAGLNTAHVHRLGIPDRYIEHAERSEQLADLGLDAAGIAQACRRMAARIELPRTTPAHRRVS
jgi:1-deoxy-D-xylulose-5-phosphate synthase